MWFDSSVLFLSLGFVKDCLWLSRCSLKGVSVSPIYVSIASIEYLEYLFSNTTLLIHIIESNLNKIQDPKLSKMFPKVIFVIPAWKLSSLLFMLLSGLVVLRRLSKHLNQSSEDTLFSIYTYFLFLPCSYNFPQLIYNR